MSHPETTTLEELPSDTPGLSREEQDRLQRLFEAAKTANFYQYPAHVDFVQACYLDMPALLAMAERTEAAEKRTEAAEKRTEAAEAERDALKAERDNLETDMTFWQGEYRAVVRECERVKYGGNVTDTERIDFLQSQGEGNWIARQSETGRGYRLHNTARGEALPTVREAIDAAIAQAALAGEKQ